MNHKHMWTCVEQRTSCDKSLLLADSNRKPPELSHDLAMGAGGAAGDGICEAALAAKGEAVRCGGGAAPKAGASTARTARGSAWLAGGC